MAARSLLAELRAPGSEQTWKRVKAAGAAVAASSFDPEEGTDPNWRPEDKFDLKVALEVINCRNASSDVGATAFAVCTCSE